MSSLHQRRMKKANATFAKLRTVMLLCRFICRKFVVIVELVESIVDGITSDDISLSACSDFSNVVENRTLEESSQSLLSDTAYFIFSNSVHQVESPWDTEAGK